MIRFLKRTLTKRNPARELALLGVHKRKRTYAETAQQMRRELGLPPHPALRI